MPPGQEVNNNVLSEAPDKCFLFCILICSYGSKEVLDSVIAYWPVNREDMA